MGPQDRINEIAKQLREGKEPPRVTVRDLLTWLGFQRRGYWVNLEIRRSLKAAELKTDPDFESAYIDAPIRFLLASTTVSDEILHPVPDESTIAATTINYADPTYRISKLGAANKQPVSVTPDSMSQEAVTLMLVNDFSQLPVMTNERDVKGLVSWTSIGTRIMLGKSGDHAREFMDNHQEIRADSSLFQAIPIIVQHQYVLVRGSDNRIIGIVTATDLSEQFNQLAEPFLLLGEIENHIRRILRDKFSTAEFASIKDPNDSERTIDGVADLTFGEYIRLLENGERWNKVNLSIDRATFCKQLDQVRAIRNEVMHFDPDGIPPDELAQLRDFARFLQRLQVVGVP